MSDIFVDGIRSVAVAHGVARIELVRLNRNGDQGELEPQVVATVMIPVAALKDFTAHLTTSLRKIEANARTRAQGTGAEPDDVTRALENL